MIKLNQKGRVSVILFLIVFLWMCGSFSFFSNNGRDDYLLLKDLPAAESQVLFQRLVIII